MENYSEYSNEELMQHYVLMAFSEKVIYHKDMKEDEIKERKKELADEAKNKCLSLMEESKENLLMMYLSSLLFHNHDKNDDNNFLYRELKRRINKGASLLIIICKKCKWGIDITDEIGVSSRCTCGTQRTMVSGKTQEIEEYIEQNQLHIEKV